MQTTTRGNNALNRARNASAPKANASTSDDTKQFQGVVIEVKKDSNGEPLIKTKENGSEYMTCKVELDINHPQTGKPIVLAAVRTLRRINDEDGNPLPEPIENSEVVEGQNVTLYVRMVDGVKYADVATGSTDNSDDAVNSALGF